MRYSLRLLLLLISVWQTGCARHVPTPGLSRSPEPLSRLRAGIEKIVSNPQFAQAQLGIKIISLDRSEILYEKNPQQLFIPASTNKIITAAAALTRLGSTYRFETAIYADGRIEGGVLLGNLVIAGGGDPTISARYQGGDPFLTFRIWARKLKEKNIRKISGDVLGIDGAFAEPGYGLGWEWNDLSESFAAPVSALQFNDNVLSVEIRPAPQKGSEAFIRTFPLDSYFGITNRTITDGEGNPELRVEQPDSVESLTITGAVPENSASVVRSVPVRNPTRYFLSALKKAFAEEGIDIESCEIRALKDYRSPDMNRLFVHLSPELPVILVPLLKDSSNLHAETLVRTLGLKLRGEGTFAKGREVIEELLEQTGIVKGGYSFADGSGLSRLNLQTPNTLVRLLQFMYRDPAWAVFFNALAVAGVDGTLAARMKGTKAESNLHAKTGTMTSVSGICGYIRTADGEMLAYAIMANNFIGSKGPAESAQDGVAALLAEFERKQKADD